VKEPKPSRVVGSVLKPQKPNRNAFAPSPWWQSKANTRPPCSNRCGASLKFMRCHTTNGRWDIVVELGVESLEAFDQALQRIQLTKGISNSETSLLLSTHKI